MQDVDAKLAKIDDTDDVMGRVQELIGNSKNAIEKLIKNENDKIDERIKLIYSEELSYPGLFGELIDNVPNSFLHLRDFAVDCQKVNTLQTKDIK